MGLNAEPRRNGRTVVLEPFLCPVACGIVQTEFVDHVGEDLCEQRVLELLHCFSVLKVEVSQRGVVLANGLGDGEGLLGVGVRGHGSHVGETCDAPGDRPPLTCPSLMLIISCTRTCSTGSPRTAEHLTALL